MSDAKFENHPDSRCAGREGTGRTGGRVWPGVCTTRAELFPSYSMRV